MHRTKQTSAIVSKINKIKVVFNKEFREINPGIFNNTDNGNYKNYFKNNNVFAGKRDHKFFIPIKGSKSKRNEGRVSFDIWNCQ